MNGEGGPCSDGESGESGKEGHGAVSSMCTARGVWTVPGLLPCYAADDGTKR